jgi:N,N-dimethylformamidase
MLHAYSERPSAAPGSRISVHMAGDVASISVVRLHHGNTDPRGPGLLSDHVADLSVTATDAVADVITGSYATATLPRTPDRELVVTVDAWFDQLRAGDVLLTLPGAGAVTIADDAGLRWVDHDRRSAIQPVRQRCWTRVTVTITSSTATMATQQLSPAPSTPLVSSIARVCPQPPRAILLGAVSGPPIHGSLNAKTTLPVIDVDGAPAARYHVDLPGPQPGRLPNLVSSDVGPLRFCNGPLLGVTDPDWTGCAAGFVAGGRGHQAVRFHTDDLLDCGFPAVATWTVPDTQPSGIYAFRMTSPSGQTDLVPFVVTPGSRRHPVTVLLPTFTYLAYANERLGRDMVPDRPATLPYEPEPRDHWLSEQPQYGRSLYDKHDDGTGVHHSAWRRPIPNLRPDYRCEFVKGARHFGADLYIVHWLEHEGIAFDVITDHDLDRDGQAALRGTSVLITGTHPEYVSESIVEAIAAHLGNGGRAMYLGGNGFYWVCERLRGTDAVEVRRGHAGVRAWESAPGETTMLNGHPGGLWLHRRGSSFDLFGAGFVAQGWDDERVGYAVREVPPHFAKLTAGVPHRFGTGGLNIGGAAGDELDATHPAHTRPGSIVIAASTGHSDYYHPSCEWIAEHVDGLSGRLNPAVRSEIVITADDDRVRTFAVGSIAWASCLSHNGYHNGVAMLTRNALAVLLGTPAADTGEFGRARSDFVDDRVDEPHPFEHRGR